MNKKLQSIINDSAFTVHDERYIYTKVKEAPEVNEHFMVSKDNDEITVVTKDKNINKLKLIEKNRDYYHLIELMVSVPFYSVGFLAAVSEAIANKEIDILIISTYSKDYILVKTQNSQKAVHALLGLGIKHKTK